MIYPRLILNSLVLFAISCFAPEMAADDLGVIRQHLYAQYLEKVELAPALAIAEKLNPDGSWPDVRYEKTVEPGFKAAPHLERMGLLAMAHENAAADQAIRGVLRPKILLALDYWLTHEPPTDQAWWKFIGVPNEIARVLILMRQELSATQVEACVAILKRANRDGVLYYAGNSRALGQNLIWEGGLQIVAGAIENDPLYVRHFVDQMAGAILPVNKEGIQADYSFHQHGPLIYNGGYGQNFIGDCTRWAVVLAGTRFAWPDRVLNMISGNMLDASRWMVRGANWDFGVLGRTIARPDKSATSLAEGCDRMASLDTDRKGEFEDFARQLRGKAVSAPEGNRCFWNSDYMAHSREGFFASARMSSRRVRGNESGHGEAVQAYHLGDGAMCLMLTGREYQGIYPLWDWRRIPGVTNAYGSEPLPQNLWGEGAEGGSDFAGGVSDGRYGVAAFELNKAGVHARKAWFFFDREVVCLGAGIASDQPTHLVTSVNQCWNRGDVLLNGTSVSLAAIPVAAHGSGWVWHDDVAYLFSDGSDLRVSREQKTGSWQDISLSLGKPDRFVGNVFNLWLEHGAGEREANYCYTVIPHLAPDDIALYRKNHAPTVLSNTPSLQAVINQDNGVVQIIFWTPGKCALPDGLIISADQSCALQLRRQTGQWLLVAGNPMGGAMDLQITINCALAGAGVTRQAVTSSVRFNFPSGAEAGRSQRQVLLP